MEFIEEFSRPQRCLECGGEHDTHPIRLGPCAMTWPTVVCANPDCLSFEHEMAIVRAREVA
jgi:hypothetical protein